MKKSMQSALMNFRNTTIKYEEELKNPDIKCIMHYEKRHYHVKEDSSKDYNYLYPVINPYYYTSCNEPVITILNDYILLITQEFNYQKEYIHNKKVCFKTHNFEIKTIAFCQDSVLEKENTNEVLPFSSYCLRQVEVYYTSIDSGTLLLDVQKVDYLSEFPLCYTLEVLGENPEMPITKLIENSTLELIFQIKEKAPNNPDTIDMNLSLSIEPLETFRDTTLYYSITDPDSKKSYITSQREVNGKLYKITILDTISNMSTFFTEILPPEGFIKQEVNLKYLKKLGVIFKLKSDIIDITNLRYFLNVLPKYHSKIYFSMISSLFEELPYNQSSFPLDKSLEECTYYTKDIRKLSHPDLVISLISEKYIKQENTLSYAKVSKFFAHNKKTKEDFIFLEWETLYFATIKLNGLTFYLPQMIALTTSFSFYTLDELDKEFIPNDLKYLSSHQFYQHECCEPSDFTYLLIEKEASKSLQGATLTATLDNICKEKTPFYTSSTQSSLFDTLFLQGSTPITLKNSQYRNYFDITGYFIYVGRYLIGKANFEDALPCYSLLKDNQETFSIHCVEDNSSEVPSIKYIKEKKFSLTSSIHYQELYNDKEFLLNIIFDILSSKA